MMGVLRLDSDDRSGYDLPDLCMKCGAPAAVRKQKTFSWFPPWVWILLLVCGLVPFAIVAMILTKRRTISVPLCEQHKNHWMWRTLVVVGGFFALIILGIAAMSATTDNPRGGDDLVGGLLCGASLVGLVIWLIAAVILQATSIRASEITDRSMTLTGVSDIFIEAFEQEWRPAPVHLDELAAERWNQGKRLPPAGRGEAAEHIQRPDEDEDRPPPDAIQEGTP
jgi:hypothetical protein